MGFIPRKLDGVDDYEDGGDDNFTISPKFHNFILNMLRKGMKNENSGRQKKKMILSSTSTCKSNLVRELATGVG